MNIDISTKTEPELKAIAYDLIKSIQHHNRMLNQVENEILKRQQQPVVQEKEELPKIETPPE